MVADKSSNLWLYTECGLISIKSDDLQQWRRHPDLKVRFDLFDAYDGAQPYLADLGQVGNTSKRRALVCSQRNCGSSD